MSNALITAVQSMNNDMRYLETVSQNMVNSATPGYKRAIPVAPAFGEAMREAAALSGAGAVAPSVNSVLDLSAGALKQTGRAWDLAINGEGFFELSTADGLAYTRAGDSGSRGAAVWCRKTWMRARVCKVNCWSMAQM